MTSATACACANIALVKYWGKRDSSLNLPAAGSLSLTLDKLRTTTTVRFDSQLSADEFILDGQPSDTKRLSAWLKLVRTAADLKSHASVVSDNNFPTASGLASSASAFAALALAASTAAGLSLTASELSELARRGSGSAARSIFPGFAVMHPGLKVDGSDAIASPIDSDAWPIAMVIAVVGGGVKKAISSRDAMDHCASTSPLYEGWIQSVPDDIINARAAINDKDLARLGEITEASAMAMHAAALASRPAIRYWQPGTLSCLDAVGKLRREGVAAYATMDAGPHVKVLANACDSKTVADALRLLPAVTEVIVSGPGPGVQLVEGAT